MQFALLLRRQVAEALETITNEIALLGTAFAPLFHALRNCLALFRLQCLPAACTIEQALLASRMQIAPLFLQWSQCFTLIIT